MKSNVVAVVYDAAYNKNWWFRPLRRKVRGEFKLERVANRNALGTPGIPHHIPGQIVGVDLDKGVGLLIEPIHNNAELKAQLAKRNCGFEEPLQEFPGINVQEWLWHFRGAIASGKVRLVQGTLPTEIRYVPPRNYQSPERTIADQVKYKLNYDLDFAMRWNSLNEKQREQILAGAGV